jgi:hypothetical protein
MPLGPVQAGLAQRMGGAPPPAPAGPPPGPGGGMQPQMGPQMGPPGMEGGADPVQRLAESLGEARMAIGEMGPERFATEGKELLRGFVGSVAQLQSQMAGGAQAGPQGMPPGPGAPPQQMGPPPAPPGFPTGP